MAANDDLIKRVQALNSEDLQQVLGACKTVKQEPDPPTDTLIFLEVVEKAK